MAKNPSSRLREADDLDDLDDLDNPEQFVRDYAPLGMVFARLEVTNDSATKDMLRASRTLDQLPRYKDVVLYADPKARNRIFRIPWHHSGKPNSRSKQVMVNGSRRPLIWIAQTPMETLRARTLINRLLEAGEADNFADLDNPEAFVKRETARRGEPIKNLYIRGRRWFQRGPGNTYHSVSIYLNDKLVHTIPFAYGYGDQYLWNAFEWLDANGYLDRTQNEPPWVTAERLGFKLNYSVDDVKRRCDLKQV